MDNNGQYHFAAAVVNANESSLFCFAGIVYVLRIKSVSFNCNDCFTTTILSGTGHGGLVGGG